MVASTSLRCWIHCIAIIVICLITDSQCEDEDEGPILFSPVLSHKYSFVDDRFFVTCSIKEGVNAVRLTWKNPNREITEKIGSVHVEESTSKPGGVDIIFEKMSLRDHGRYHCSAMVDGRELSRHFDLHVFKRVSFVDTPPIQYASEGSNYVIRCDASGQPSPNITWRFNGTDVTAPKFQQSPEGLVIRDVTRQDGGVYQCRGSLVTTYISDFNTTEIKLIILYKPEWKVQQPTEMYSFMSGVVNLTCQAEGEPAPSYTWLQDNSEIIPDEDLQIIFEDNKTILEINRVDVEDFTQYTCVASNSQGSIRHTILLKEGAKPGLPNVRLIGSDVDSLELRIDSSDDYELQLIGYKVEYKKEDQDWMESTSVEFSIDAPSFVLEGLEQDTEYVVRVAAQNEAGYGDYTTELSRRTLKMRAESITNSQPTSLANWQVFMGLLEVISFTLLALVL